MTALLADASSTGGYAAAGVFLLAAVGLATIQARRRTLTRRQRDVPTPDEPRRDDS